MSREEILKRINDILKEIFDDNSLVINYNTTANDVPDWDSLNHINIISSIESEFGLDFSMQEVISFKNVGDIVEKIIEKNN